MSEPSREFKGVWIRASLWMRNDLTWFQKCLIAEIDSLQKGCFAGNEWLAKRMQTSAGRIANELSILRKKQIILDWGFDGRQRQISVADSVSSDPILGEGSLHAGVNAGFTPALRQTPHHIRQIPIENTTASDAPRFSEGSDVNVERKDDAEHLLKYLNEKAGRSYRMVPEHINMIVARLSDPEVTGDGIAAMIDRKVSEWNTDEKMRKYLRPQTLFAKANFAGYYDERDLPLFKKPKNCL